MIDINVFGTSFSTNVSSSVILVASEGSKWTVGARSADSLRHVLPPLSLVYAISL